MEIFVGDSRPTGRCNFNERAGRSNFADQSFRVDFRAKLEKEGEIKHADSLINNFENKRAI